MRPLLELPEGSWDQHDDLVSPCSLEMAVVKALVKTHAIVAAYTTRANCRHNDIDDYIFAVIISGMISLRLGFNKVEVPDMPGEISDSLCSICMEMMDYNKSTIKMYIDHYITHGTSGLDDLINSDDTFHIYLLFMDIKSVVSAWIDTTVIDLPLKKKMKKLDQ